MENLEEIKNFGPYMVKILNLIGIHTKVDLLAADYKKNQSRFGKSRNHASSQSFLFH